MVLCEIAEGLASRRLGGSFPLGGVLSIFLKLLHLVSLQVLSF